VTSVPVLTVAPAVVEPPPMTEDAMMADEKMSGDAMMVHEDHEFTIRIENISSGASVPSLLAQVRASFTPRQTSSIRPVRSIGAKVLLKMVAEMPRLLQFR